MSAAELIRDVLARESALKPQRSQFEPGWEDVITYVMPERGKTWVWRQGEAPEISKLVFDNTAADCLVSLSHAIDAMLFGRKVWEVALPEGEDPDDQQLKWLEDAGDTVNRALNDERTGFITERLQAQRDLIGFGSACLFFDENLGDGRTLPHLVVQAVPLMQIQIDLGYGGAVSAIYRRWKVSLAEAAGSWGEENLSPWSREMLRTRPHSTVEVLHAVYPAPAGERRRFRSVVIEVGANHLITEGRYSRCPYLFARWHVTGGIWGWGIANQTMELIRTINLEARDIRKAAAKMADPSIYLPDSGWTAVTSGSSAPGSSRALDDASLRADLDLSPGGVNRYDPSRGAGMELVRPMPLPAGLPLSIEHLQLHREELRKLWLYYDMGMPASPQMTATEVLARRQEAARKVKHPVMRTAVDMWQPLGQLAYAALLRAGAIRPPPDIEMLRRARVNFLSPSDLTQEAEDGRAIAAFLQAVVSLGAVEPDIVRIVDYEEAARKMADAYGVPEGVLKSHDDYAAVLAQLQKQRQMQAGVQAIQQGGQAAESVGKGLQVLQGGLGNAA